MRCNVFKHLYSYSRLIKKTNAVPFNLLQPERYRGDNWNRAWIISHACLRDILSSYLLVGKKFTWRSKISVIRLPFFFFIRKMRIFKSGRTNVIIRIFFFILEFEGTSNFYELTIIWIVMFSKFDSIRKKKSERVGIFDFKSFEGNQFTTHHL